MLDREKIDMLRSALIGITCLWTETNAGGAEISPGVQQSVLEYAALALELTSPMSGLVPPTIPMLTNDKIDVFDA